jgi:peptidoglycan/xylan/chitin deacetylase (PgdA/CDA1 family)
MNKMLRQARGVLRSAVHLALVLLPAWCMIVATSTAARLLWGAGAIVGLVLLERAAFIYMAGWDPLRRVLWHGPRRPPMVAITFDDGPNGAETERVLDVLARHQARATFFMVGSSVEAQPELARKVAALGHEVGSHTYSHVKLHALPDEQMRSEVDRGHACLTTAGIAGATLMRAPHGLKTRALLRHLTARGLKLVGWSYGIYDTRGDAAEVLTRRALRWLGPGKILLLHDGKLGHARGAMIEALDRVLAECNRRGLQTVTISQMAAAAAGSSASPSASA